MSVLSFLAAALVATSGAPQIAANGLKPEVLKLALRAHANAKAKRQASRDILVVIDYSLPSVERRLWVIDVASKKVLFQEQVAHGKNSGEHESRFFSDVPGSKQTSLGTFVTLDTYFGKHGYSLKLRGLDRGLNTNAEERAIVIHGADYVSTDFISRNGRLGRSFGCPAVRNDVAPALINAIKKGAVLFAYYPSDDLLRAPSLQ